MTTLLAALAFLSFCCAFLFLVSYLHHTHCQCEFCETTRKTSDYQMLLKGWRQWIIVSSVIWIASTILYIFLG